MEWAVFHKNSKTKYSVISYEKLFETEVLWKS